MGCVVDPAAANNSATDVDQLTPTADLEVTVTDGAAEAVPGLDVSYLGPSDADGSRVSDLFPAELGAVVWACEPTAGASCTGDGSGDIDETVLLAAGARIVYLAEATIDLAAAGPVVNTAAVTAPPSVTESDPGDNSATVAVAVWLFADGFESGDLSAWSGRGDTHRHP